MITIMISDIAASFRSKEYDCTLYGQKKLLLFSEAVYEKVPRLHQHLLTLFRRQGHSDTSQHPGHTREQQLKLRQLFFSRRTRYKWQQPLTIGFSQRLNPFSHGQRLSCKLW